MILVDTHCHLNDEHAFPLPSNAIEVARKEGVKKFIVVGIDTKSSLKACELADEFEDVYAVVGWHPNHASEYQKSELAVIEELLKHPKVVALGEIGLDYYRDHASRESQFQCLRDQLDLAHSVQCPVVFHCRDAYDDLLGVMEQEPPLRTLYHCFAGNQDHAKRAVDLGSYLGVDGPVTYKSSDDLRRILSGIPRDRLVIETDSPWMAPVPYRGQRNQPSFLVQINNGLAETLGIDAGDCAKLTTGNAISFFGNLGI